MIADTGHEFTQIVEENIPEELQELDQWVCWRGEWSESKEKLNKVPKQHNGNAASSTDESTWTTFGVALAAAREKARFGIGLAGLERTPYTGVDLDNCIDLEAGEIKPAALKIVEDFDSYTEVTPSGDGLRIWIEAEKTATWTANKGGETDVEVYSQGRFFTVTGEHLEGTPQTIERRQEALDAFMVEYAPRQRPAPKHHRPTKKSPFFQTRWVDLYEWLQKFGVVILGPYRDRSSEQAYSILCPWAHEHTTGASKTATRVGQYPSGAKWFHCEHSHCDGRRWEHFREHMEPGCYEPWWVKVVAKNA
jgi:hypothetical protein